MEARTPAPRALAAVKAGPPAVPPVVPRRISAKVGAAICLSGHHRAFGDNTNAPARERESQIGFGRKDAVQQ
jgi:hypothetical protein